MRVKRDEADGRQCVPVPVSGVCVCVRVCECVRLMEGDGGSEI